LKKDSTCDKHSKHFAISKFMSYINRNKIPTDEKKEVGYMSKQPPKLPGYVLGWEWVIYPLQADGKDMQMFWARVEQVEVQFAVNQSFAGNKANEILNEMKLNFISNQKNERKNLANSMINNNSIAISPSSYKKVRHSVATSSSTRLQNPDKSAAYTRIYEHCPYYFLFFTSSESESGKNDKSDKDEDAIFFDINTISFDDYLNQNRIKSGWKLKDGRPIVDILNTKTADAMKLILEKNKKEKTQFMKSVIQLSFSLIIDLSSEFENRMFIWFGQDWVDIKRKVYKIVNMKLLVFEGEIKNIIDTIEEEGVLDNFLKENLSNEDVPDSKILGIQFSARITIALNPFELNDASQVIKPFKIKIEFLSYMRI
ncbi:14247_t:CDS:2, partial [Dentiscutata heterogama]